MPVSYGVEAVFAIEDRATGVLERISERLSVLDGQIEATKAKLAALAEIDFMGGLNAQLATTIERLERAAAAAVGLQGAFTSSGVTAFTESLEKANAAQVMAELFGDVPVSGSGRSSRDAADSSIFGTEEDWHTAHAIDHQRNLRADYWQAEQELAERRAELRRIGRHLPVDDDGISIPRPPSNARFSMYDHRAQQPFSVLNPYQLPEEEATAAGAGIVAGLGSRLLSLRGMSVMGAGYIAGSEGLKEDLAERQIGEMFGVKGADLDKYLPQIRGIVRQSAAGTIYSQQETAAAASKAAQTLADSAPELMTPKGLAAFGEVLPIILRGAETAQQLGMGDVTENVQALTMYAHLTGRWAPGPLETGANRLMALAIRTGMPMEDLEKTMAQGVPMAMGAGADVDETAALIGYLARGGLGRRAGYAVGQMILGTLPHGGPNSAHLQSIEQELEHSIRLQGQTPYHFGAHDNVHMRALKEIGLMDEHGQSTVWTGPNQTLNMQALEDKLSEFWKTHTAEQREKAFQDAFQIRGLRGASLFKQDSFEDFKTSLGDVPDIKTLQSDLAQSPLYQLEQIWARLKDIGNTLFTSILPGFEKLEAGLLAVLTAIDDIFTKHPDLAKVVAGAAIGATGGAALGGFPGAVIGGAGGAAAAGIAILHNNSQQSGITTVPALPGTEFGGMGIPLPGAAPSNIHKESYSGGGVHIDNLVVHGAPSDADSAWVERIMHKLSTAADHARMHNTGLGWGSFGSPYDAGASA